MTTGSREPESGGAWTPHLPSLFSFSSFSLFFIWIWDHTVWMLFPQQQTDFFVFVFLSITEKFILQEVSLTWHSKYTIRHHCFWGIFATFVPVGLLCLNRKIPRFDLMFEFCQSKCAKNLQCTNGADTHPHNYSNERPAGSCVVIG